MTTVDERAGVLYEIMRAKLNEPFTRQELLSITRYENSDKFDRAIRRARQIAEADGLFLPCACPKSDWVYCVTDDYRAMVDPTLWISRVAQGAGQLAERHEDYLRTQLPKMPRRERAPLKAWLDMQQGVRQAQRGAIELTKALIGMRRDEEETE